MKLFILDNGWENLDKAFFIAGANCGVAANRNPIHEWIDIPMQAFLIKHEDGCILFDTGCDPHWIENWPPYIPAQSPYYVKEEQQILYQLEKLKVSPEDIKYVVISHLHHDHAGTLHYFKNAEVYVNEQEFLYTLKAYVTDDYPDVHIPSDIQHFIDAKLKWHLIEDDVKELELVPGIKLLNLGPGHSFGMVAMQVELEHTGSILLVSDAIYFEESINPQIKVPGILYDSVGYKKTVRYLLDYARKTNSTIWYGHDIKQFSSLKKALEGYYD